MEEPLMEIEEFLQKPGKTSQGLFEAPLGPTDWYYRHLCPKTPAEMLDFRESCLRLAYRSRRCADELWMMCARDVLFYVNFAGFLLEPREKPAWQKERAFGDAREVPFITRSYQDDTFLKMWEAWGKRDIKWLKSRDMGASWVFLYLVDHSYRFRPQFHIGMASKDEAAVDAPGSTDSLFWKLDFIEQRLPWFLKIPQGMRDRNQADHMIVNKANGSTIQGFAATVNVATGGRKTVFIADEMHKWQENAAKGMNASLQAVTNCRVWISTPFEQMGPSGTFYDIWQHDQGDALRIETHWTLDEEKAAGLYTSEDRVVKILDRDYDFPPDYKFILDGKTRSPFYDYEWCRTGATPRSMAAEFDMDFSGAGGKVFEPAIISRMKMATLPASMRAELARDDAGNFLPKLIETSIGDIALYRKYPTDADGVINVTYSQFSIGCDISQGTGGLYSSQSSAVGLDLATVSQVFEWLDSGTNPTLMADIVFCLGMIFHRAIVIPEINGPGGQFMKQLHARAYPNIYIRHRNDANETEIVDKATMKFGLYNLDGGLRILKELQEGVRRKGLTIYSERVVRELAAYIEDGGRARHPRVSKTDKAADKTHGDAAIGAACAWYGIRNQKAAEEEPEQQDPLPGSFAYRRLEWLRKQASASSRPYWNPSYR
jgi:hypothetical protein